MADESYDPVSRIRKGRIFLNNGNQPLHWKHIRHPLHNNALNDLGASLCTFSEFNFYSILESKGIINPYIVLGTGNHSTIWTIVDAEGSISGEVVLFLKARKVIGALPKVDYSLIISAKDRSQIEEKLELLYKDLVSAVPDSVVDRCREAACAAGNTYLIQSGVTEKATDLGKVASNLTVAGKQVAANQAATLATLHSRTKTIEQSNRGIRKVNELDAEFAVHSLGLILIELGFGYW